MSQHDYSIANDTGAAVRADMNNALQALASNNLGTSAPATTYAGMWWADSTNDLLKIRNAANSAWITVGTLSALSFLMLSGGTITGNLAVDGNTTLGNASGDTVTLNAKTISAPNKPAFLAHAGSTATNQTGAGTGVTVQFSTEVFDQGGDYNSGTGTFTAPVAGRYRLSANVTVEDLSTAALIYTLQISTSNRNYTVQTGLNPKASALIHSDCISVLVDMDAADIAQVLVSVTGMAGDTADISGSSSLLTSFSGELVA